MKIALCLSGQIRSYQKSYEYYLKNLIENNDVDVFIHTWNIDTDIYTELNTFNQLKETFKPKSFSLSKQFPEDQFKNYTVIDERWPAKNTFQMWYSVFKANELKREHELTNGFKYDMVVRTRFDFALNTKIDLNIEKNKLYVPNDLIKGTIDPNQMAANDQFAYGDSDVMDLYSQTFWNIDRA